MADFIDQEEFGDFDRSPMVPCMEPTSADFEYDADTLIWVNIAGEMRLYSYNGAKVQYQTLTLSSKVDAT